MSSMEVDNGGSFTSTSTLSSSSSSASSNQAAADVHLLELESLDKLLQDVSAVESHFSQLQSARQEFAERDFQEELRQLKDEFARLKRWYIQCETKQGFLENVVRSDVLNDITPQAVAEREKEVEESKQKVHQATRQLSLIKKDISKMIRTLSNDLQVFDAHKQQLLNQSNQGDKENLEVFPKSSEQLKELRAKNASTACFGRCDDALLSMDTESKCLSILEAQGATLQQLQAAVVSASEHMQDVEWQIPALQQSVQKLRSQVEDMEKKAGVQSHSSASHTDAALEAKINWYRSMKQILCKLVDSKVDLDFQRQVLQLTTQNHLLSLHYDQQCVRFSKIEVVSLDATDCRQSCPCQQGGVGLADILDYAVATQNISFLLSEVQQRFSKNKHRALLIKQLEERYQTSILQHSSSSSSSSSSKTAGVIPSGALSLSVSFNISSMPSHPAGVSVLLLLSISPDFPAPVFMHSSTHGTVSLLSIELMDNAKGICPTDKQSLTSLMAEVNSANNHILTEIVAQIETKIRALLSPSPLAS